MQVLLSPPPIQHRAAIFRLVSDGYRNEPREDARVQRSPLLHHLIAAETATPL